MRRQAQVWSLDFAMSMLIFLTAFFSLIFAWNYMSTDVIQTQQMREMQLKGLTISDSLIRTPGIPFEWNGTTVQVLGLALDENVLNATKVKYFVDMSDTDYDRLRGLMDIGQYDFYLEVLDLNGTVYGNTTTPIDAESPTIVPIERYAMYNDRIVKLKLVIWT